MVGPAKVKKAERKGNRSDHMANERTFLAWIRTSIGIMAFGFVVEKFALFIDRISLFLEKSDIRNAAPVSSGYSKLFAVALVVLGALMGMLSFIRYKKVEKEIEEDTYRPSLLLDILLTMGIIAIGMFIAMYMMHII